MRISRILLILLVFSLPASLLAQEKNLTLSEALTMALQRNLSVVQAQNNVEAAQSQVLAAQGNWIPSLSAGGGWTRSQQQTLSTGGGYTIINGIPVPYSGGESNQTIIGNNFQTRLSANWTVFDGLNREASNTAASSQAVASEYSSTRTRQSVAYQVFASYLNVLRNEQLVKVTDENLKRDRRQLERIVESNRVGALSLADVYRQQSQVANDELSVINAQNNYDKSKADLLAYIGADVYEEVSVADPSIKTEIDTLEMQATAEKYKNFGDLAKRAIQARPDFLGATQTLQAADAQVTSARSSYWPQVYISAGYSRYGDDLKFALRNSTLNWGLGFQWNLFDQFRTNQSVQSAIAQKRNAEISLSQTQININVDVKKALLDLEAARKSMTVGQTALVSAEEDRKIAEERYNLGAGTLLDLLVANANLVNAQANLVNSMYGYITAKYAVEYVLGEWIP